MYITNYARRCKSKTGSDRYHKLHAATNESTFCGKGLNEMWFIESSAGLSAEDITCVECKRILATNP